jgi:hypothetical protein
MCVFASSTSMTFMFGELLSLNDQPVSALFTDHLNRDHACWPVFMPRLTFSIMVSEPLY